MHAAFWGVRIVPFKAHARLQSSILGTAANVSQFAQIQLFGMKGSANKKHMRKEKVEEVLSRAPKLLLKTFRAVSAALRLAAQQAVSSARAATPDVGIAHPTLDYVIKTAEFTFTQAHWMLQQGHCTDTQNNWQILHHHEADSAPLQAL